MIPVKRLDLQPSTLKVLAKRQASANKLSPCDRNIQIRWQYFLDKGIDIPQMNRDALDDVCNALGRMFYNKCCYCEKVIAKDIEHFYPKTLYPDRMFCWDNMLRACKDCNFEKLDADPEDPLDSNGERSLLDPTVDRPEDYLQWDLLTGMPIYINAGPGIDRGQRTVSVCDLDNQKFNEQRRKQAFRFRWYLERVSQEDPVADNIRCLLDDLLEPGEPWQGIIRQIIRDPYFTPLIQEAERKLPHLKPRLDALRWTHPTRSTGR